jgi:rubredoxin
MAASSAEPGRHDRFRAGTSGPEAGRPKTMMKPNITRRLFLTGCAALAALGAPFVPARTQRARGTLPRKKMRKWQCVNQDCEPYIYDPSIGDENANDPDRPIPPGVAFEALPEDWVCPVCGDPKSLFVALDEWVSLPA